MMARLLRFVARVEDHWMGDVLALIGLWGFGLSAYFLGFGVGL